MFRNKINYEHSVLSTPLPPPRRSCPEVYLTDMMSTHFHPAPVPQRKQPRRSPTETSPIRRRRRAADRQPVPAAAKKICAATSTVPRRCRPCRQKRVVVGRPLSIYCAGKKHACGVAPSISCGCGAPRPRGNTGERNHGKCKVSVRTTFRRPKPAAATYPTTTRRISKRGTLLIAKFRAVLM